MNSLPLLTVPDKKDLWANIPIYSFNNTFNQQNFIISYMHPEMPYKSLVVCYQVGMGKTYASACLAQLYIELGYRILYLSNSLNSINGFDIEYNKVATDARMKKFRDKIDRMTFTKFFNNLTKHHVPNKKYGLIILDEVHNLREDATRYEPIIDCLKNNMKLSKLLIISATPMIDSENELNSILGIGEENGKIVFSELQLPKHSLPNTPTFIHTPTFPTTPLTPFSGKPQFSDEPNVKIEYQSANTKMVESECLFLSEMKGLQLTEYNKITEDTVHMQQRQASISCSDKYDPTISLEDQSSKLNAIFGFGGVGIPEHQITVIFCFYVTRGINFVASVLEHNGWSRWISPSINNPLPKQYKGKTYAIIDGQTPHHVFVQTLRTFNSIGNMNGQLINVLLGSSVMNESLTLHRVRNVHILSPFWNFGQIEQSLGRVVRYGSHTGLPYIQWTVKVYLHAAYYKNGTALKGVDLDMWKTATKKRERITETLESAKHGNVIPPTTTEKVSRSTIDCALVSLPLVDNRFRFKIDDFIWDLSDCFEHNKFKISWCRINLDLAKGYSLKSHTCVVGKPPQNIIVYTPETFFQHRKSRNPPQSPRLPKTPLPEVVAWRSAVDDQIRITNLWGDFTHTQKSRSRGKIINNMNVNELKAISKTLGTPEYSATKLLDVFKSLGLFIENQIIIVK
jgi:hypothetical protein